MRNRILNVNVACLKTLADVLKQKLDDTPQDEYTLIELTRKDVVTKTFE